MKKIKGCVTGAIALVCVLAFAAPPVAAEAQALKRVGGKPDLNGIWQVLNTAAWDIQDHSGALGTPPGLGVVEGNEIPYQPWAAAKKADNFANRAGADPTEHNCFLPGVPRATYMPFPFKITHTPKEIAFSYEFTHTLRPIVMDGSPHPETPEENWMGISRGRWEGDTLVIDVRNFNDQTWFDHAGNFHSEKLHVIERYTRSEEHTSELQSP